MKKVIILLFAFTTTVYPQQCNSAQWNARCSVITQAECVQGGPNEGCLVVGSSCTNCYRGDPERAVKPPPKKKPKRVYKPRWVTGKFIKDVGWEIESPGSWARKGLRKGDVITEIDGKVLDSADTLLKVLPNLHRVRRFKVVQQREVAAR